MVRVSTCAAVWAVALAEMRSARRQVRTWVFSVLAVGGSLVFFIDTGVQHADLGWITPVTEFPAPRFAMSAAGMLLLLAFLFGAVFLAFDVRARDQRERMVEVLDTRPVSNVELLLGRIVGLVGTAFLAALTLVALVQMLGGVAGALGAPTEPVQVTSLATFLFVDAFPILLAWVSVVVLLAVLLKNRLLVAVAALGLLAAWVQWAQSQPLYLSSLVGLTVYGNLASDLLPRIAEPATALHRLAIVVAAVGVLYAAAALHPRLDSRPRPARVAVAAVLIGVAAAAMAGLFMDARSRIENREHWLAVHQDASSGNRADIEHVAGTVRIDPGRELAIDVVMRLVAPAQSRAGGELVMSFNPGMTVRELHINGAPATAVHRDGLLRFEPPLADGAFDLGLRADGVPDPSFAYLDSAFDFASDRNGRRNAPLYLGRDASIYDADYVALMPGVHWLPRPGANVGLEDPGSAERDLHTVDLAVEVPHGWLVAGPGLRQGVGGGEFRFNPRSPVPAVALIASRFERRGMEVAGVELEILMSPEHVDSLAVFEDAVEPLGERLRELFDEATSAGLDYPYRGLSVVEVPATLRRCGGGWRMDTVQALPGILLLNERGFPTARFDHVFRRTRKLEDGTDPEEFKIKALERYFRNDYAGGDPFVGLGRNLVQFQTGVAANGMAGTALEFVVEELANLVLSGAPGFFSAHVFTPHGGTSLDRVAFGISWTFDTGQRGFRDVVADRPAVWDVALGTSLAGLDPVADPVGVSDLLLLRGGAVARSIFDAMGRQQTAALLRELRHRGSYDVDTFYEAAEQAGTDLRPLLGDWLNDAGLPGFVASSAIVRRLPDTARGEPRFETRVNVRNDEPVPGLVRLRYATARWRRMNRTKERGALLSEPVRVPAHSSMVVSLVTPSPVTHVWLAPYLSLNRTDFQLAVETADETDREGFTGTRPSDWAPPPLPGIVVDDLDPGFVVERSARRSGFRIGDIGLGTRRLTGEMDHGIPNYDSASLLYSVRYDGEWRRQDVPSSFGRYRHTVARAGAADGYSRAVFSTELPEAGEWRLDYHMPFVQRPRKGKLTIRGQPRGMLATLGDYDMVLQFGNGEEHAVAFDASGSENGWNDLGRFDLPEGTVRLVVSNRSSGDLVLADAVRWRPTSGLALGHGTTTGVVAVNKE
ncbi:MAG: hypothetical protein OXI79_01170 [Gammaproteobacteria bacterium]|nr:hypothetical protein [Gammaproteobacteria bacterium]